MLESQLARGFFPDVSMPGMLPLGSPVLQRKTGYRELFRYWLQFHAGAALVWEGGADVFHAGARNVATLYEYWLFFQLEALFRQRFDCDKPLHALVLDKKRVPPQLVLQRGIELATPVAGVWAKNSGRKLRAEFHFNQKFKARTAGAYVLYPGNAVDDNRFEAFHEVLPGLGAFAIRPDPEGKPIGKAALEKFFDEIIEHVANRTTSRERVSYHVSQTYEARHEPVPYGAFELAEKDQYANALRAPPPAEEMVLVAWYKTPAQLALAQSDRGLVYVRLGLRRGALHVPPNLAAVRKVLLRTTDNIAPGLLVLRTPGLDVITRASLRDKLNAHPHGKDVADWQAGVTPEDDNIYALFQTTMDDAGQSQAGLVWDAQLLNERMDCFAAQLGEAQPQPDTYPRVIPLREILQARKL
jgi:hypothetical protein